MSTILRLLVSQGAVRITRRKVALAGILGLQGNIKFRTTVSFKENLNDKN